MIGSFPFFTSERSPNVGESSETEGSEHSG